jgi:hypothetical protein
MNTPNQNSLISPAPANFLTKAVEEGSPALRLPPLGQRLAARVFRAGSEPVFFSTSPCLGRGRSSWIHSSLERFDCQVSNLRKRRFVGVTVPTTMDINVESDSGLGRWVSIIRPPSEVFGDSTPCHNFPEILHPILIGLDSFRGVVKSTDVGIRSSHMFLQSTKEGIPCQGIPSEFSPTGFLPTDGTNSQLD